MMVLPEHAHGQVQENNANAGWDAEIRQVVSFAMKTWQTSLSNGGEDHENNPVGPDLVQCYEEVAMTADDVPKKDKKSTASSYINDLFGRSDFVNEEDGLEGGQGGQGGQGQVSQSVERWDRENDRWDWSMGTAAEDTEEKGVKSMTASQSYIDSLHMAIQQKSRRREAELKQERTQELFRRGAAAAGEPAPRCGSGSSGFSLGLGVGFGVEEEAEGEGAVQAGGASESASRYVDGLFGRGNEVGGDASLRYVNDLFGRDEPEENSSEQQQREEEEEDGRAAETGTLQREEEEEEGRAAETGTLQREEEEQQREEEQEENEREEQQRQDKEEQRRQREEVQQMQLKEAESKRAKAAEEELERTGKAERLAREKREQAPSQQEANIVAKREQAPSQQEANIVAKREQAPSQQEANIVAKREQAPSQQEANIVATKGAKMTAVLVMDMDMVAQAQAAAEEAIQVEATEALARYKEHAVAETALVEAEEAALSQAVAEAQTAAQAEANLQADIEAAEEEEAKAEAERKTQKNKDEEKRQQRALACAQLAREKARRRVEADAQNLQGELAAPRSFAELHASSPFECLRLCALSVMSLAPHVRASNGRGAANELEGVRIDIVLRQLTQAACSLAEEAESCVTCPSTLASDAYVTKVAAAGVPKVAAAGVQVVDITLAKTIASARRGVAVRSIADSMLTLVFMSTPGALASPSMVHTLWSFWSFWGRYRRRLRARAQQGPARAQRDRQRRRRLQQEQGRAAASTGPSRPDSYDVVATVDPVICMLQHTSTLTQWLAVYATIASSLPPEPSMGAVSRTADASSVSLLASLIVSKLGKKRGGVDAELGDFEVTAFFELGDEHEGNITNDGHADLKRDLRIELLAVAEAVAPLLCAIPTPSAPALAPATTLYNHTEVGVEAQAEAKRWVAEGVCRLRATVESVSASKPDYVAPSWTMCLMVLRLGCSQQQPMCPSALHPPPHADETQQHQRRVVVAIVSLCEVAFATATAMAPSSRAGAKPMSAGDRRWERRRALVLLFISLEPLVWTSANADWAVASMQDVDVIELVTQLQQWLTEERQHVQDEDGHEGGDDDLLRRLERACQEIVANSASTNLAHGLLAGPGIDAVASPQQQAEQLHSSEIAALVALAMR
jgi:hypothetical protein